MSCPPSEHAEGFIKALVWITLAALSAFITFASLGVILKGWWLAFRFGWNLLVW